MKCNIQWWYESTNLRLGRVSGEQLSTPWNYEVSSASGVWLWLNYSGDGLLWGATERYILKSGMFAMTGGKKPDAWTCIRYPGNHLLEIVVLSKKWLDERFEANTKTLHPELASWLHGDADMAFCGLMGVWEKELCYALKPSEKSAAYWHLLVEAKILEWAAIRLYRQGAAAKDTLCSTYRKNDPVRKALEILRNRFNEPLQLIELAAQAGIAPDHLSRRVSAETGLTLQKHLRRLRIERACEELRVGKTNVTNIAYDVGYQSLSHFAKAFREEVGMNPSAWQKKNPSSIDGA